MKYRSKTQHKGRGSNTKIFKPIKDDDQTAHSRVNYQVDKVEEPQPEPPSNDSSHHQMTEMPSFLEFVEMLNEVTDAELKAFSAMVHSSSKSKQSAVNKAWMDARTAEAKEKNEFNTAKKNTLQKKVK
jgi:hypothetical protein